MCRSPIVLGGLILAGLVIAGSAGGEPGKTHKWKMATSWTGGPLMEEGAKAFARRRGDEFHGCS